MKVIDLLKNLKGNSFYYIPNPGNAGDSLIACSTYQIFDDYDLNYSVLNLNDIDQDLSGSTVVLGGGGNFISLYPNMKNFFKKYHGVCDKIYLLPHTIRGQDEVIECFSNSIVLFCRELTSFNYLSNLKSNADFYLDHDMAFTMDVKRVSAFVNKNNSYSKALLIRNAKMNVRFLGYLLRNSTQDLYAFRQDSESSNKIPITYKDKPNIDISQAFAADSMGKFESYNAVNKMIQLIERYKVVHTDRLHVCILSALLGKKVKFYSNSYDKNRSIYEYSIKDRFNLVEFLEV